jgi:hypothetical protein
VGSSKTHPHIDSPSDAQLRKLIETKSPTVGQVYLAAHRLVLDTLADVAFSVDCVDGQIGYGAGQYGYNRWGLGALAPHTNWVSLGFLRGAALDDPDGLLEGTGASVRHVKLRSPEQLAEQRTTIQRMLRAASTVGAGRKGP